VRCMAASAESGSRTAILHVAEVPDKRHRTAFEAIRSTLPTCRPTLYDARTDIEIVRELRGDVPKSRFSGSEDAVGRHHTVTRRLTFCIRIMHASAWRVHSVIQHAIGRVQ
jgi:hypothetical protein